jgi:hypothetical protein
MLRKIRLATAALGLGAALAAAGQAAEPFAPQVNTSGAPVVAADKLVPANAVGAVQAWHGRAWWQVMAFCVGAWENAAYEAEHAGDKARADALRAEAAGRFYRPALKRLMDDRGIDADVADGVIAPDINFQFLVAADEERPFADDQARCRVYWAEMAAVAKAGG